VRRLLAGGVVVAMLLFVGAALAARGFADKSGDVNTAPDITSVDLSEAVAGVLTMKVSVGNFRALPTRSWINLWFDLDSDDQTGDAGDEALVRYVSTGEVEVYLWDGSRFVTGEATGISANFTAGALTLSMPKSSIGATGAFGILAVTSRAQLVGNEELIASDYAPDAGRSAYTGTALTAFPDPLNDHDAAPDMTSVRVTDAKSGWVTFSIKTPNYATLPAESGIVLTLDADDNAWTGDAGAEVRVTALSGEISLERWKVRGREWVPDALPTRVRYRNAGGVVTIEVNRSELGTARRLRFSLLSVDLNSASQEVLAADFAPDNGGFWRYIVVNKPKRR
jgi:hypothetical protein